MLAGLSNLFNLFKTFFFFFLNLHIYKYKINYFFFFNTCKKIVSFVFCVCVYFLNKKLTLKCLAAFTERNTYASTYFNMGITLVHVACSV